MVFLARQLVVIDEEFLQFAQKLLAEVVDMLWAIFVILLVLWLLGVVTSYTLGGFIHILLVMALVVILIRIIQGRSPVT